MWIWLYICFQYPNLSLLDRSCFVNFLTISSLHLKIPSFTHLLHLYLTFTMILALIPFGAVVQSPSYVWLFVTPWTAAHQAFLSFTMSQSCSNSCPSSRWCHPAISFSVAPFSCPQSFPASGSFPMNRLFTSGGQSIATSYLASVFPMNLQGWLSLGLTSLSSLMSKGLSRVFSSTTIWKHQFFSPQPSLWPNSHISTWLLEKS